MDATKSDLEPLHLRRTPRCASRGQFHPEVDLAYDLVQQFTQMLRERQGERLDDWLMQVNRSNLPELPTRCATNC
jgi:hypothetical protein